MADETEPGPGRTPPPSEHWYLKGQSGNKRGRPKGAVSLKKLVKKVALKKHRVTIEGRAVRKTLLQLVIEVVINNAAKGTPSMVALSDNIRARMQPPEDTRVHGLLVVPEELSTEEWIAQAKERNARHPDEPGTYENVPAEEFLKAVKGIPTPLGEAILEDHYRWGGLKRP